MQVLSIVSSTDGIHCDPHERSKAIVQRIRHEQRQLTRMWSSLAFYQVEFTPEIATAVIALLRQIDPLSHHSTASKQGGTEKNIQQRPELCFYQCPRNEHLNRVIFQAMKTDIFQNLTIQEHDGSQRSSSTAPSNQLAHHPPALRLIEIVGINLSQIKSLKKLRLCGMSLSTSEVSQLRRGLEDFETLPFTKNEVTDYPSPLEQLFLSNIRFMPGAVEELCHGFVGNRGLREVSLVFCGLEDSQVVRVASALEGHPSLTHLRLSWNHCRDKGLRSLARLVWNTTDAEAGRLESLDLQHQSFRCGTGTMNRSARMQLRPLWEAWNDLSESLQKISNGDSMVNHSLKRLVLSGNGLADDDMVSLAALLPQLSSLEELDLDSNQITSTGLRLLTLPEQLRDFVKRRTTIPPGIGDCRSCSHSSGVVSRLRTLRLSLNPLAHKGSPQETLARLLRKHPELHAVHATDRDVWRRFDDAQDSMLEHLIGINSAGRCLLLRHGPESLPRSEKGLRRPAPSGVWPLVLARIERAVRRGQREDAMFFLLRNGPVLFEKGSGCKRPFHGGRWSSPIKRRRGENV